MGACLTSPPVLASDVGSGQREHDGEPLRLGYQPALDGLRGVAVVAVLLYHGGVPWASGGYLGVDVFFVLSGFLITSLLVTEWETTGRVAVVAFYGRRARRLFPALVPVLAFVAYYAVVLARPTQVRDLAGDMLATVGYVTNWHLIAAGRGYFDAFAGVSPLRHTWSLAVEEQWYLLWPLASYWLLRRGRTTRTGLRITLAVTSGLCLASALWMAVLARPGSDPSRVYYGTDTRAQELLLGAVLAVACALVGTIAVRRTRRLLVDVCGAGALVAVLALCATVNDATTWLYEGGMLAFSGIVAVVVVAAVQPVGRVRSLLAAEPLRFLGLISYGLYLWHFPIFVVCSGVRMGFGGTPLLLVRLALTGAASVVSYRVIELPVRRGRLAGRRLLVSGLALTSVAMATVLVGVIGAPPSDVASLLQAGAGTGANVRAASSAGPSTPALPSLDASPEDVQKALNWLGGDMFDYDPGRDPAPAVPASGDAVKLVMTGDSAALTLSMGFARGTGDRRAVLWDRSIVGCSLFPGERVSGSQVTDGGPQCKIWRDDRKRWLAQFRPDVVAVLSGVWESYDKVVDGRRLVFGTPGFDRWFSGQLEELIISAERIGARVAFLTVPCNRRAEGVTAVEPPENDRRRLAHLDALYRSAAQRHPGVASSIDLGGYVCRGGRFDTRVDGVELRSQDGVHFTLDGAAVVWRWLLPKLVALAT